MSPRFVLGRENVPCVAEVVNRSLKADCTDFITQFCRIKGCGGAGCPPPPTYRRKENLSESPNRFKYRKNILISRFYEQFSRSSRNLGHFWKFEKISNSLNTNILYIILKRVIWRCQIYNLFREKFKFRGFTKAF